MAGRTAGAVAVVAALATLTACGGGTKSAAGSGQSSTATPAPIGASAMDVLMKVADRMDRAHSVKVVGTIGQGAGSPGISSTGAFDWSDGMTGEVDLVPGSPLAKLGMLGYRYTPDAMYTHYGSEFARHTGGRHWLKFDYATLAKVSAQGAMVRQLLQNNNPVQSVKLLIAGGDVKKVGTESLYGVTATHYAGVVDADKLVGQQARGLDPKQLKLFKDNLAEAGVTSETIDLWVDSHDLPVKKREELDSAGGRMVSTVDYSDYGVAVDAQAPPASDTVDSSELPENPGDTGAPGASRLA
ncbi:putative lipoprotein [Streptantibioticus cattleyicolor NRRL 8057 = DSM 46488]|uniref:Putative lipoprotein n=1 Tax=Streptantibioticus cattleyicolor (strain ATCC 35852 / DSM 46488 / JCM 4925 / NBRC 14057 / NRRL 8057) TaxID=1003195 RepID=F8JYC9_STREN|nr:putative lipoprotein [Streptantibioticus cattleyicolor NRRL 8057 = DSM 46488]MYS60460.1 hypothetical protein [Streptomyces sp. SID5468]CCB76259.1 Uncharacterized 31.2 kDa protein in rplA-rplJ intergenic region [Streptantibioticus cattleyicolor NRRL 8057 = DSM 46488]